MNTTLANARRRMATVAAVCAAFAMTTTATARAAPLRPLPDPPPIITGKGHAPLSRIIDRALSHDRPIIKGKRKGL
jgi:hypothetical protein